MIMITIIQFKLTICLKIMIKVKYYVIKIMFLQWYIIWNTMNELILFFIMNEIDTKYYSTFIIYFNIKKYDSFNKLIQN